MTKVTLEIGEPLEGREPVYMRRENDCLRAANAYVLGIPYEETPDAEGGTPEAQNAWVRWYEERGLQAWAIPGGQGHLPPVNQEWWIAGIEIPTEGEPIKHAVVGSYNKIVFDPEEDSGLLDSGLTFRILDFTVIRPVEDGPPADTPLFSHQGTYRVYARVFTTSGTAVQTRLAWDVGDLVYPTTNDAVRCYDGGTFHIIDYGEVRLDQPPNTTGYRWQGQIQAKGDAGGENFSVDRVWFQPVGESAGLLQAPLTFQQGLVAYSARSEFNTESGAITGDSLTVGGTWAAGTGSDTDDFSASGGIATRSSTSDTGTGVTPFQGRFVLAGTTTYSSIAASIDFKFSAINDLVVPAVLLRYTDKDNNVAAWAYNWQEAKPELHIRKIVGGAVTELALVYVTAAPGSFSTLGMMALDNGLWQVVYGPQGSARVVAQGSDSALATGGSLASGKVGFADTNTSSVANTRTYDNFAAWVPTQDAVIYASRSAELNTLGISRQDTGGTAYGPVSQISGDLPRMPNRSSGGTAEFIVKASRGDLETVNDPSYDSISARVYRRASYLLVS